MKRKPDIEQNSSLVLSSPQHYHVEVFCYESEDKETHNFNYSTRFELIGNDVKLINTHALALAEPNQKNIFVKDIKQCSDPTHLEGLDKT